MEFIDEICTQMLELEFGEYYNNTGFENVKDKTYTLTDEAQDFYNNRYDEIETLYENLIVPKINPFDSIKMILMDIEIFEDGDFTPYELVERIKEQLNKIK